MCLTPESPSVFPLRFSSIRCEGFELRAEVRAAHPFSVTLLLLRLPGDRAVNLTEPLKEKSGMKCNMIKSLNVHCGAKLH